MEFSVLKKAVQEQFTRIQTMSPILRVDIDTDLLWDTYLASFPTGTDPKFRVRTEHDCSCCRSFVKNAGSMVAIDGNHLTSLWDLTDVGDYQPVADAMAALVKSKAISNLFLHGESTVGTDKNQEYTDK